MSVSTSFDYSLRTNLCDLFTNRYKWFDSPVFLKHTQFRVICEDANLEMLEQCKMKIDTSTTKVQ